MQIKVELDDDLARKFLKIKSEYGLKTSSETIRLCISNQYKRLFGTNAPPEK